MVADWVQTERHLRRELPTPRPIGMGSYNMDSHNVQRYVDANGHARNEGDIQINPGGPYPVDYGAIVPRRAECENLLVPVCLSSSHIAYGSIRMEPVFMILGQSAATAAAIALDGGLAVQEIDYDALAARLTADRQVLASTTTRALHGSEGHPRGIVIDDTARLEGRWRKSTIAAGVHRGYLHDGDLRDGSCTATFAAELDPGSYRVEARLRRASEPREQRAGAGARSRGAPLHRRPTETASRRRVPPPRTTPPSRRRDGDRQQRRRRTRDRRRRPLRPARTDRARWSPGPDRELVSAGVGEGKRRPPGNANGGVVTAPPQLSTA